MMEKMKNFSIIVLFFTKKSDFKGGPRKKNNM